MSELTNTERETDDFEAGLAALGALSATRLRNAAVAATALTLTAGMLASALHADTGPTDEGTGASLNPFAQQYNQTDKLYVPPTEGSADDLRGRSETDLKARFDEVEEGLWEDWSHDLPKGYYVMDKPMDPAVKEAITEVAVLDKTKGFDPGVFNNPYPHGSGTTPMPRNGVIGGLGGGTQCVKRSASPAGRGATHGRPVRRANPGLGGAIEPARGGIRRGSPRARTGPVAEGEASTGVGGIPIGVIIGTLPDIVMPIVRDGQGGGVLPTTPFVQVPDATPLYKDDRFAMTDPGAEVPIPAPALLFPAGLALLQWKRRQAAKKA